MNNIKMSKDLVMALLSVSTSIVTIVVDKHKEDRQAERIAELVVNKLAEKG